MSISQEEKDRIVALFVGPPAMSIDAVAREMTAELGFPVNRNQVAGIIARERAAGRTDGRQPIHVNGFIKARAARTEAAAAPQPRQERLPREWTLEDYAELKRLWKEEPDVSLSMLATRFNKTKAAITGIVHRAGLPARPSPIFPKPKPPEMAAPAPVPEREFPVSAPPAVRQPEPSPSAAPARAPAPRLTPGSSPARFRTCQWPMGEPRRPGFRFCDEGSLPGKPYCVAHCAAAFVKPGEKREEAA